MAKRWYVLHAYSGFEQHVKRSLEDRIKHSGMTDKFGEILVPTEEVVEMRGGQKRRSERKFFPGYVLVQMELDDDSWHLVKSVPKIMGFVGGSSDRPSPISDREADQILNRVQEGAAGIARRQRLVEIGFEFVVAVASRHGVGMHCRFKENELGRLAKTLVMFRISIRTICPVHQLIRGAQWPLARSPRSGRGTSC
jgi:transcription termination/antitermination protein NusG